MLTAWTTRFNVDHHKVLVLCVGVNVFKLPTVKEGVEVGCDDGDEVEGLEVGV